jgi:molybdopterin converting factor small subunit
MSLLTRRREGERIPPVPAGQQAGSAGSAHTCCVGVDGESARHPCSVELLGTARLAAGERVVELDLGATPTLAAVVGALAMRCPALVGPVLDAGRPVLTAGHVFCLNGRDFVADPATPIRPGDRIILLASAAGG